MSKKMLIVSEPPTAAILASHIPGGGGSVNITDPKRALLELGGNTDIRSVCIVSDREQCQEVINLAKLTQRQGKGLFFLSTRTDDLEGFRQFAHS